MNHRNYKTYILSGKFRLHLTNFLLRYLHFSARPAPPTAPRLFRSPAPDVASSLSKSHLECVPVRLSAWILPVALFATSVSTFGQITAPKPLPSKVPENTAVTVTVKGKPGHSVTALAVNGTVSSPDSTKLPATGTATFTVTFTADPGILWVSDTTDLSVKAFEGKTTVTAEAMPVASIIPAAPAPAAVTPVAAAPASAALHPAAPTPAAPAAPAPVAAAVVMPAGPAAKPSISPAPVDGDSKVTITTAPALPEDTIAIFPATVTPAVAATAAAPAVPATATAPAVPATAAAPAVPASSACNVKATPLPLAPNTSALVLGGSQTTVLLKDPLVEGQQICVAITPKAGPPAILSDLVTVGSPAAPPGFDWGLVRAYFTLGALTSQERDQFSHEDLFLSFHLDKSYIRLAKQLDGSGKPLPDTYRHHPGLNTFFDTRLTALPVAVQNCTPSAAGVTPVVTCSNASTGAAAATATPTAEAFLNSQKSARLQFGLYSPIILHQWHVAARTGSQTNEVPYALFIAPMIKVGFDTTLNGLNQTQQSSSTPSSVQPIGTSSEFYKFYDYGFRLGHYAMTADPDVAPKLLSYIDVSVGRFGNLASLLCNTALYTYSPSANTCSPAAGGASLTGILPWNRELRLNVEGLLEIPATKGFSVGFSANVVFDPLGRNGSGAIKYVRPADDLRFLFAYKFDITKIAAKLAPQFSN